MLLGKNDFKNSKKYALEGLLKTSNPVAPIRDIFRIFCGELEFTERHQDVLGGLAKEVREHLNVNKILCFGDSHVSLFEGIDLFHVHRVGAATAYNLKNQNSSTQARSKIFNILDSSNSKEAAILLSFGELDIRAHIPKASLNEELSLDEACHQTVDLYINFCREISQKGYKLIIYGPFGSGAHEMTKRAGERYYASVKVEKLLREKNALEGYIFFSLHILINHSQMHCRRTFEDGLHFQGIILREEFLKT